MHPKQLIHINKDYLKWIRKKPCLVCGAQGPNDAHRVWNSGKKNHGNDLLSVSLCRRHHTFSDSAYHNLGHKKFEELWNIDLKDEIINLLLEYLGHKKFEELWNIDLKDEIINLLSEYIERNENGTKTK